MFWEQFSKKGAPPLNYSSNYNVLSLITTHCKLVSKPEQRSIPDKRTDLNFGESPVTWWSASLPTPFSGSLSPTAEGCGHTSLPQSSWITHVSLIPFALSVKPARTGLTCTQRHACRHTPTRAQVPVLDKVEALASSGQVAHIMGNPISFYQPWFALITTACPKALNPCAATRPPTALCQGSSSNARTRDEKDF